MYQNYPLSLTMINNLKQNTHKNNVIVHDQHDDDYDDWTEI